MKEDLLQFIWQHKLLKPLPLMTVSGKEIKVLRPGELNQDSGPDFFNARIELDGLILAGNIEVHVNSSDWLKHNHQEDRAYDNIILHVVYKHDKRLEQNSRFNVEVLELKTLVAEETLNKYKQLIQSKQELPCHKQLPDCSELHFLHWLDRVLVERLQQKVGFIRDLYKSLDGDYTQTFFTLLLKAFGFKVNAQPFEFLGRQMPVHLLLRHANDLKQTEALLLGMAGLLEETFTDSYPRELQNEFEFLKRKYQLIPLNKIQLKYSRMRPGNFPDLRLAQFAAMVHWHPDFLQAPQVLRTGAELNKVFESEVSDYWKNHYRLDMKAERGSGHLSKASGDILLINTLVPFLFFYATKQDKPECRTQALYLLETCEFENNRKTRLFQSKQAVLKTAAQSQACIQLFDAYCSKKRCLNCGIAATLLKAGR
ncbi:MAG: DUF2851 family protein [Bacteroidia bacterium]|nr:DUF2851 family protein [Bacteroidia bacterium]